jgi:predicted DNA-binding transcriptional regulator AlpA
MGEQSYWIGIAEAGKAMGLSLQTVRNMISQKTFPLTTYKIGKRRVVDREVLRAYFEEKRAEGLAKLAESQEKAADARAAAAERKRARTTLHVRGV